MCQNGLLKRGLVRMCMASNRHFAPQGTVSHPYTSHIVHSKRLLHQFQRLRAKHIHTVHALAHGGYAQNGSVTATEKAYPRLFFDSIRLSESHTHTQQPPHTRGAHSSTETIDISIEIHPFLHALLRQASVR